MYYTVTVRPSNSNIDSNYLKIFLMTKTELQPAAIQRIVSSVISNLEEEAIACFADDLRAALDLYDSIYALGLKPDIHADEYQADFPIEYVMPIAGDE